MQETFQTNVNFIGRLNTVALINSAVAAENTHDDKYKKNYYEHKDFQSENTGLWYHGYNNINMNL